MENEELEFPWALFNLGKEVFAVSSKYVQSIFILENVIKMPNAASYVKGVVNLRGEIIPVIDTRIFYGLPSVEDEVQAFSQVLELRKQDHINWLNELEASVREKRTFGLTTDPHACAFGKWYDSYKTDNLMLQQLLKKFDAPHKRIHHLAKDVHALEEEGEYNKALNLIEKARNREMKQMVGLFDALVREYSESQRNLAIVLKDQKSGEQKAITVDNVIGVEMVINETSESFEKMPNIQNESLKLAKREKDGSPLFLIDEMYLLAV